MTVGCARCHEHKFDPIEQQDYYRLYATFAGVFHGSRVVATEEQKRRRERLLNPLREQRERLIAERSRLRQAIIARAEKNLASSKTPHRPKVSRYGTEERFAPVRARYVRLVVENRDDNAEARTGFHIDEFEVWTAEEPSRNVALSSAGGKAQGASRVAEDFADAYSARLTNDGKFGARWIAAEPRLTITLAQPERIDRVVFSSDRTRSLGPTHGLTTFVGDYRIEVSLDGENWECVADSLDREPVSAAHRHQRLIRQAITPEEQRRLAVLDREIAAVDRQIEAAPQLPRWWVGNFRQVNGPFFVFKGGSPQRHGEKVSPASPGFLGATVPGYQLSPNAPEAQRRKALAEWIVHPNNPLTPRVLANRLWHYHFGTGIVSTPSDFGMMGERPTHPQLLDWLACQVHRYGWRLKPLHRLIVLSQTYRQSAAYRADAAKIDGASRYLWRFPPRRLSGEEIRDAMLLISGQLDERMGGPGFRLYRYLQDNVATYVPLDRPGRETYRRSVYHQSARACRVDLLSDFDSPDCAFATPRRVTTTSPLQALTLLNHHFTIDMAAALANRLERECPLDGISAQVRRAFRLAYGREPDEEESRAAQKLIRKYGLPAFCRALFNSNEFIYVH